MSHRVTSREILSECALQIKRAGEMSITLVLFAAGDVGGFWPAGWRPDEGVR